MNDFFSKSSYIASFFTAIFGLTVNDVAVVVGIVCTFGTFIVNWIYKRRYYNLEKLKFEKGQSNGKPDQ